MPANTPTHANMQRATKTMCSRGTIFVFIVLLTSRHRQPRSPPASIRYGAAIQLFNIHWVNRDLSVNAGSREPPLNSSWFSHP